MADHPVFSDDLKEIVESFITETIEIFDQLDNDLLQLERTPQDAELVNKIFRAVHTVKGTSGFLSLEQLSVLAHHFEDVLNKLRRGELQFRIEMMDIMFDAFDHMKLLLQQIVDRNITPMKLDPLYQALSDLSEGKLPGGAPAPAVDIPVESFPAESFPGEAAAVEAAVVPEEPLPTESEPAEPTAGETPRGGQEARGNQENKTIRVDVKRLDNLMDLVGELVLGRNRLLQVVANAEQSEKNDRLLSDLVDTNAQIDFITTELQTAVMNARMVQIGRTFNKFPRLVRDLAREFEKQIELVIEGEETEMDKSLVEEISDPLVHLIRNAADHGVELPAIREERGKPARGRIRLSAAHEGNHIILVIEDDGAGLDAQKLKQHALGRGIITAAEAAEMSDSEAHLLIFRPGFSTAKAVSQVSGRGVGMDVVKTNLTRLNGSIRIDTVPGQGTRFTLKLPLTLAITQSLLVRAGMETYAIPLHAVTEVVRVEEGDVYSINRREVMRHRGEVLPLIRIGRLLRVQEPDEPSRQSFAVVVAVAHHRVGLVVDAMESQKEIVIKPLGNYLKKVRCVAGSTILGDGRVIMILDVPEVIQVSSEGVKTRSVVEELVPA